MKIHSSIEALKKKHTFNPHKIFKKNGRKHSNGLKKPHSLFDIEKSVVKNLLWNKPDFITIPIEINDVVKNLYLQRVEITTNIITGSGNKSNPDVVHYRGCLDSESSWSTFTIRPSGIVGIVSDETGNYNIGQVDGNGDYVIAHEEELTATNPNVCDSGEDTPPLLIRKELNRKLSCHQLRWYNYIGRFVIRYSLAKERLRIQFLTFRKYSIKCRLFMLTTD